MQQTVVEFADVLSKGPDDLGITNLVEHTINVGGELPSRQPPRKVPLKMRDEVGTAIEDMKYQGVIEPSTGPWSSPIVLVSKKDGTTRLRDLSSS